MSKIFQFITIALIISLWLASPQHLSSLIDGYCKEEPFVLHVQLEQIKRAKLEVFGQADVGFVGDDLHFYLYRFPLVQVYLVNNTKDFKSIVYYRIYKNANDNIRSLLYNYEIFKSSNFTTHSFVPCVETKCISSTLLEDQVNTLVSNRFPFTFTRDPLKRFISAITEVILSSVS